MEHVTYTDSAIVDRIITLLNTDKYYKTIQYFRQKPHGTFRFNPLDDPEVNDGFIQETEKFPELVRRSVTQVLCQGDDDEQLATLLKRQLKIELVSNNLIKLNEWSSNYEGTPISAKCQIVGTLKEETYTKVAKWFCVKCGHVEESLEKPYVCENRDSCTSRRFFLDQSTLLTGDIKTIIVQEPMDEVKHGKPRLFTCIVKDDLVFDSYPGQRKILTGVFRSQPKKNSDRNSVVINVISMENLDEENIKMPTEQQLVYFVSLVKKEDYLKLITDSFAPEIKFRELEKLAVVISRIGSMKNGRIRGNIHSLLIGPPATAKSKILEFLPEVTQRCGLAVGGMSTGSGITVTMTTLEDKSKFPKGGIVVQCSGSCVVLDELNQFPQEDIGKTYTAMESGKIPYNKAGFDQVFTADTTIVAGANPKNGYYDQQLGMVKNINLPAPMISRFDIIVNVLPESSEIQSQQISDHSDIIKSMGVDNYVQKNNLLTSEEMLLLFNKASSINPKMSFEAKKIIDDYVKVMMSLQNSGQQEQGTKQFDRRFIESVVRISEAITRLHLSDTITKEYAVLAIDYIKKTLETFGVKTDKGMTQIPMEHQDLKDKSIAFEKCWIQMCKDADNQLLPRSDFCQFLSDQHQQLFPNRDKADEYFEKLHQKGDLLYQRGRYKLVR